MDPFFAECRANGRIAEYYRNNFSTETDKIAATCYGYLYLTPAAENIIREKLSLVGEDWESRRNGKKTPAIVKEYIATDEPTNLKRKSIRRMRDDLWKLQQIGVYPIRVEQRYYRGGLLADLGYSWTLPCALREVIPNWVSRAKMDLGPELFDRMIAEPGFRTSVRAVIPKRTIKTRSMDEARKIPPRPWISPWR